MRFFRALFWSIATLPVVTAFAWASLAARFPEPVAGRRALGECLPRWGFAELLAFDAGPAHVVSRLLHLALLQIPDVTLRWIAVANAALAALLAMQLARVLWREASLTGVARAVALFVVAMLVCSPAHGGNWLHFERVGRFAVPLLFVAALLLFEDGPGRRARACTAVLLATLAPFCHALGAVVFLALVPAIGTRERLPWIVLLLLFGNLAAVASFYSAGSFHLADTGLIGGLLASPLGAVDQVLCTTGRLWPDVLHGQMFDERLLGLLSWLSPLLWWIPRRPAVPADAPRGREGVLWSCVAFGLLAVLFHYERHGIDAAAEQLPEQVRFELLYGGFVLPLGVVGLLAARVGAGLWPLAGGAALALSLSGFEAALTVLRQARVRAEAIEVSMALPDLLAGPRGGRDLPTRDLGELLMLEERGLVPGHDRDWTRVITTAIHADPKPELGTFAGGNQLEQHGTIEPRLFGDLIGCVLIGVSVADGPFQAVSYAIVGLEPDGALTWTAKPVGALPEGAKVVAVGVGMRQLRGARLAGSYTVANGVLVANPASDGNGRGTSEGR